MWFGRENTRLKSIVLVFTLSAYKGCEAITNAEFNTQIRGYSMFENNVNLSDIKTLQKQGQGLNRYANFVPVQNQIKYKDNDDSVISGSDHARGLHGHTDLTVLDYASDYEDPHIGHGYEYPGHDYHQEPYDYHHYNSHDLGHRQPSYHGYGEYGHGHYKYHDHGLSHKALIWPLAGIALLGAAAALVTNPVLLQLGVVSGKRRRRHIEDIENTAQNSIQKWSQVASNHQKDSNIIEDKVVKKRMLRKNDHKVGKRVLKSSNEDLLQFKSYKNDPKRYSEEDRRFIPIPLQIRNP